MAFYGDIKEAIPLNAHTPLGKSVDMWIMVYSDHAGNKTTRRSHTGFITFVNLDLVQRISKKQPTVESTAFED